MRILAGDIGGTKTAVAVVRVSERELSVERFRRYPSGRFVTLEAILLDFLGTSRRLPDAAGFGVAGPVREGRARITKLPWIVDERALAARTRIPRVRVVNDFVAAAMGIPYVSPRRMRVLRRGDPEPDGPVGLIGAGTGLGQAVLFRSGPARVALASEGGHADFGPRNAVEDSLVSFVRTRFGRVSRDRLLSGEGLTLLYDFFRDRGLAPESRRVSRAFAGADRAAVISRFGLEGRDRLCRAALKLFVSIYGSEAGNLALQYRATGGIFLAGGIAAKILPALEDPVFLESFEGKPPLQDLLSAIPVRVILEPRLGLFGAAAAAYFTVIDTRRSSSKRRIRPAVS
jgi:glucokinase